MLDLDRLAGESPKSPSAGRRQSRILAEDLQVATAGEGRASKGPRSGKRMAISGFIPIVSLEHAKGGKQLESEPDDDSGGSPAPNEPGQADLEGQQQQMSSSNLREQLAANFGAKTSIGHASFANQQQQQHQDMSYTNGELEAGRTNRKLTLAPNGLLAGPRRFVSSLMGSQTVRQIAHMHQTVGLAPAHPVQGGPMGVAPVASLLYQPPVEPADCICVPFFQCKGSVLNESQLSRSQIQQLLPANSIQVPKSLPSSEPHHLRPPVAATSEQQFASPSQPIDPQAANDIYEQLRKSLEGVNLDQLQAAGQLDERSKSASDSTLQNSTDIEGRSLLSNPLASRRHGGQTSNRCGIMRTCCRIPRHLGAARMTIPMGPQVQALRSSRFQQLASSARFVNQLPVARPQTAYQMFAHPQPELLSAVRPLEQQQPAAPVGQQNQADEYQFAAANSALGTTLVGPSTNQEEAGQGQPLGDFRPPGSSFMGGRCGIRQALGIAGRVQNVPSSLAGEETSTEFGEFPAHAAILKRLSPADSLFVCSAVLISGQWLATAAHCVRKLRPEELKVRLGEWDVNRDDEFYPFSESNVREIVIHPDFQPNTLANDLALVRLADGSHLDSSQWPHIAPACLAQAGDQTPAQGQRCWVAGWGKDAFGQRGSFQSVLRKVDLPVIGHDECELALRQQTKLGRHFRLHARNICAGGERGKDACEGDGGAGLYCLEPQSNLIKAIGIVSWGVGCGQRGVPGVYVDLASFQHWMEAVVAASGEENVFSLGAEQQFKSLISERQMGSNSTGVESLATTTTPMPSTTAA